jgi:transketolase
MSKTDLALDQLCVDTIRALSIDAILEANSGHPGLPLGAAPAAWALWSRHLRHSPKNPSWADRDRFVLSAGHGSMLLYSLLHLTGYDLPLKEIQSFRQWGSRTPGHPEHGLTPGVETTTGPLGQGFANSVGMAIAEAHLAARFNRPGHTVVDHHTYALAGDGDLMEGVALESASLAGHLGLGKLVCLYDANRISLAGATDLSFTQDVGGTCESCGWHVQHVADGNDIDAVDAAITAAKAEGSQPSLIVVRSNIGFGSPKQDTFGVHGAPLKADEVAATKKALGFPSTEPFFIPKEALADMRTAVGRGEQREAEWRSRFEAYRGAHPELAAEFERAMAGELAGDWDADIPTFPAGEKMATRKAGGAVINAIPGGAVINAIAGRVPELVGGSADLNPSTNTALKGMGDFQSPAREGDRQGAVGEAWGYGGRNVHFGVREHAMGAIASGLALHGGTRPYTATFLVFADYMRPSIRLAALMELPVVYVFTHDSVAVGEDGPTHEPVEQAAALRVIPHLTLLLSRQALPIIEGPADVARGGYVLADVEDTPELVLMASGSEVALALEAREILGRGRVRVVSMPSPDLFLKQDEAYRDSVLPPKVWARMALEAGVPAGWHRLVGPLGEVVAIENRFGASAPGGVVMEKYGFSAAQVVERGRRLLEAFPTRAKELSARLVGP